MISRLDAGVGSPRWVILETFDRKTYPQGRPAMCSRRTG